jgi:hypothetical protein
VRVRDDALVFDHMVRAAQRDQSEERVRSWFMSAITRNVTPNVKTFAREFDSPEVALVNQALEQVFGQPDILQELPRGVLSQRMDRGDCQ